MRLLGIDIGTGGTRAVLLDGDGRVVSSATAAHPPFASPHAGWAEQDPDDWWRAACSAVPECLARGETAPREISGIGLTGQMHGLVLLDRGGRVLRPSILWCDQRTEVECREITETVGAAKLIELTANPALTNFTLPKIWWVQKHEPDVWARVAAILLPKDYIRLKMSGSRATDVADASGTLLFDVANRQWSPPMMELSRLDAELLPRVFESCEVTGHVSEEGARATGLCAGTSVDCGRGRPGCGSREHGNRARWSGQRDDRNFRRGVCRNCCASARSRGRVHTFCHAVPQRWHVMGVTQAAGYSLRWFRDQFGAVGDPAQDAYAQLMTEASTIPAGADGLMWAPYLMGERTPHLDPNARGALVGISATHTRAHVVRAILEGVAFSLRDTLTIFAELKIPVESIRLGGGGARGAVWRQIQADVYGTSVGALEVEEGRGVWRGAARGRGRKQLDERRECGGCSRASVSQIRAEPARRGADESAVRRVSQVVSSAAGRVARRAVSQLYDQDLK